MKKQNQEKRKTSVSVNCILNHISTIHLVILHHFQSKKKHNMAYSELSLHGNFFMSNQSTKKVLQCLLILLCTTHHWICPH